MKLSPNYNLNYSINSTNNQFNKNVYFSKTQNDTFTLSFQGLKKSDFKGLDSAIVENFKAPVQQFKTKEDFDQWALNKIETEYLIKNYPARDIAITAQRKAMIEDWNNYLTQEGSEYAKHPAWRLLILDAITKDLKPNTNKIPPALNQGALAATINYMDSLLIEKPKSQLNFTKIYNQKVQEMYTALNSEESSTGDKKGVWVMIPSKDHDPEHFEENVDKLKALSHPCWCTKSTNAEPYLSKGDFHIYLVDNKPKAAIRFVGDKIEEIQGPKNNSRVPVLYAQEIKTYTQKHGFEGCEDIIENGIQGKELFEKTKLELKDAIENKDWLTVLNHPAFNCNAKLLDDGLIEVDSYLLDFDFSLSDLGIKENELFDNIERVNGSLDLTGSEVTRFKNLKEVAGDLHIEFSQIKDTGSLERIGDSFCFASTKTKIGDKLVEVGGEAFDIDIIYNEEDITNTLFINKLPKNKEDKESIFKALGLKYKKLDDGTYKIAEYTLDQIQYTTLIKEALGLDESDILDGVSVIVGDVDLECSDLESLGTVKKIGGNLKLSYSQIKDLGELQYVRGDLDCSNSRLENLGNLRRIDGNLITKNGNIRSLGSLQIVKGNCDVSHTGISRTRYLRTVGGNLILGDANIKNLDHLKEVEGKIMLSSYLSEQLDSQLWAKDLWFKTQLTD